MHREQLRKEVEQGIKALGNDTYGGHLTAWLLSLDTDSPNKFPRCETRLSQVKPATAHLRTAARR